MSSSRSCLQGGSACFTIGDPRQRSWCVKNDRSRTTGSLPSLLPPCSPKAYGPVAEGRSPRPVACFMLGFKSRNFLCGQDCSVLPCLKAIAWRPPAWDRFPTTSSFCSCDDFRSSRPPIPRRGSYGECSVGSGDPRQRSWCVKNDRSRTTGSLPSLRPSRGDAACPLR